MELVFEKVRGDLAKRILGDKMTQYNSAVWEASKEEIEKKNLWRNEAPIPTEAELRKEFEVYKVEKQSELDEFARQEERSRLLPEINKIAAELHKQDPTLGFLDPLQAIEFMFTRDYGDPKEALDLIKANQKKG